MKYLLDTTVLIPMFNRQETAGELVMLLMTEGIAVSVMSFLEVWQGTIDVADSVAAQRQVEAFFTGVPLLPVSIVVARRCAELRAMLVRQGKNPRRRSFDLVIAATAREHGMTLVTHNVRDFADIPGLELRHP